MLFSIISVLGPSIEGLERTASSLKAQEYGLIEWIVINTVPSRTISDLGCLDMDLRWIDLENLPPSPLDLINGEYVMYLQPGDGLGQTQALQKANAALVVSRPSALIGDSWVDVRGRHIYRSVKFIDGVPDLTSCSEASILLSSMFARNNLNMIPGSKKFSDNLKAVTFNHAGCFAYLPIPFSCISQKKTSAEKKSSSWLVNPVHEKHVLCKTSPFSQAMYFLKLKNPLAEQIMTP